MATQQSSALHDAIAEYRELKEYDDCVKCVNRIKNIIREHPECINEKHVIQSSILLRSLSILSEHYNWVKGDVEYSEEHEEHTKKYELTHNLLDFLLEYGADVNCATRLGSTPLIMTHDPMAIEKLIAHGADVYTGQYGGSILYYFAMIRDVQVIDKLMELPLDHQRMITPQNGRTERPLDVYLRSCRNHGSDPIKRIVEYLQTGNGRATRGSVTKRALPTFN